MKRLVSLTMAAACAMSLAVPAFAANDIGVSDAKDSGYTQVIPATIETQAATFTTNADGSKKVELAVATQNATVTIDGVKLSVPKGNGLTVVAQARKLAQKIEAINGWDAEILYGGTEADWKGASTINHIYVGTAMTQGQIRVNALESPTAHDTTLGAIEDLTLNDIFLGYNSVKGDVRAFYESGVGNDSYGVLPNKTIYFVIRDQFYKPSDIEFDLSKVEGSKYVKSITDTQESFSSTVLTAVDNQEIVLPKGRYRVLKVKLKENMTDDEYKLLFDLRVKVKEEGFMDWKKGDTKKFEDIGETWVSNDEWVGDSDWAAGTGGVMIKPQKNEDNEIIWYDENRDIAKVEFYADSDTDKFFVKLSTKWNNEWYSDMFRNTDAFIFNFVGAPKISATSRSTLTIYNPFVNDDDELEVDLDELKVYKVLDTAALAATTEEAIAEAIADGRIEDVTNLFTAGENEDGDQVLTTRTRDLGTYIVTTATPADLVDDVVVDSTNNGKVNPGTGR